MSLNVKKYGMSGSVKGYGMSHGAYAYGMSHQGWVHESRRMRPWVRKDQSMSHDLKMLSSRSKRIMNHV